VEAFKQHGEDFIVRDNLRDLVTRMNELVGEELVTYGRLHEQITARDREMENPFTKDAQILAIHGARNYRGDKLVRTARPHKILDPANGPLIAVRLNILTRKTLGGLHTNLNAQVLGAQGEPIPGLYAAGEVAGFGGGGYHGYNALEGTLLGGCLFSGRHAGRHAAVHL
jgi:predicted oxidoreductase